MIRPLPRRTLLEVEMWGDLVVCTLALCLASGIATKPLWQKQSLLITHPLRQVVMLVLLLCAWHLSLVLAGLYRSYRLATLRERLLALLRGIAFTSLSTTVWIVLHIPLVHGNTAFGRGLVIELLLAVGLTAVLLAAARACSWLITFWLRKHGRNLRYLLIVGSNSRAIRIAQMIHQDRSLGYALVGFVDDRWHATDVPEVYRPMLVGPLQSMPTLLRTLALDEVMIALPLASAYGLAREICEMCHQQGIVARCEVSLFTLSGISSRQASVSLQFTTLNEGAFTGWNVGMKRLLDFTVALIALSATLPLLLLIAAVIKLSSKGPVFFVQDRLGLGKRSFKIYKFRTMIEDAEQRLRELEHLNQSSGPTFKLRCDPRITRAGAFLRKTSLDELPQLINVLLGDMSLVGPRPLPLRDYEGFSEDWHRRRFSVKPGITCLWQVMGRSSIGFDRWMELDMSYIDNWSIWLDFRILFQTIPAVLRGSGAM